MMSLWIRISLKEENLEIRFLQNSYKTLKELRATRTVLSHSRNSSITTQIYQWVYQVMSTSLEWWSQPGKYPRKITLKQLRQLFHIYLKKWEDDYLSLQEMILSCLRRYSQTSISTKVDTWQLMKLQIWLPS